MDQITTRPSGTCESHDLASIEIDLSSFRRSRERWPFDSRLTCGRFFGLYVAFSLYMAGVVLLILTLGR